LEDKNTFKSRFRKTLIEFNIGKNNKREAEILENNDNEMSI